MNADSKNEDRNHERDNLKEISGIGPDYEKELHQCGILTFAQLAQFDNAQQLHRVLEKSGSGIKLWKIEKFEWIEQARKKVINNKPVVVEDQAISKPELDRAAPTKPWMEHAAFIVSFDRNIFDDTEWRTRVYKTENGDEVTFAGMVPSAWINWIFEQAKLTIDETQVDKVVKANESELPGTELVVTHAPSTKAGKQLNLIDVHVMPSSTAVHQRELTVQVDFELLGSEAEIWAEEMHSYRLELYLLDSEKKVTELVASTQKSLNPGILAYEICEVIPIPSPGKYELYVLLFSLPPTKMIVTHHGPIINVVPHPVSAL